MKSLSKKNWLLIVGLLLVFGLIRLPFETHLRKSLTESEMLVPSIGPDAMSQLRNSALVGTLGGLRPLIATYFLLASYHHFETNNWDENRNALVMVTFLEPNQESHWVDLVWHRGVNAVAYVQHRSRLPEFERELRAQKYTHDAIELGRKGLEYFPDAIKLRAQIAHVYKEKMKNFEGAAEMYQQMIDKPGAPMYTERFHAYYVYEIPGREWDAYHLLTDLYYESERNHLPTLRKMIITLQEKLDIPSPMWIPETDPDRLSETRNQAGPYKLPVFSMPGGVTIP